MGAITTQRDTAIKQGLVAKQKMVNSLLGDKKKADKFIATAAKVAGDHKLANCNVDSIIDACVTVAQIGLDLSPVLSHAYLVPFKNTIQLIVSARGYTALLARTGWQLKSYIVHEGDHFEYHIDGFDETVKFEKDIDGDGGEFKYAVALAKSPEGELYVEVMNAHQIEKHRKASSNQNGKPSGVWEQWFDEMAKKTVIKKLVKTLPLGEDIATATSKDDKMIDAEVVNGEKEVDLNSIATKAASKNSDIPPHDEITGEVIEAVVDDAQAEEKPNDPMAKYYSRIISSNVKRVDIHKFIADNDLTVENVEQFLADPAAVQARVEAFYAFGDAQ